MPDGKPSPGRAGPGGERVPAEARAGPQGQRQRIGSGSGQQPIDRRGKIVVAPERRPEFAVGQRIAGAAGRQAERRRAARHRFEKRDAEPLAGRRHHEKIGHPICLDQRFRRHEAGETHAFGDPEARAISVRRERSAPSPITT